MSIHEVIITNANDDNLVLWWCSCNTEESRGTYGSFASAAEKADAHIRSTRKGK